MSTPSQNIDFQCAATGLTAIAVALKYDHPVGARTAAMGMDNARGLDHRLRGAGIETSPWAIQFCADCVIVFLVVPPADLRRALAALLLAFSQFDLEATARLAVGNESGELEEFFPDKGARFLVPPEIILASPRIYALDAELQVLLERREELLDAVRLGTTTDADAGTQVALINERFEAARTEVAALKTCGRQS